MLRAAARRLHQRGRRQQRRQRPAQYGRRSRTAAGPCGQDRGALLVVISMPSLGIGDTFAMAYSRAPQQRALYQNASWADRPSNRVVQLLVRRIDARAAFVFVVELGGGVGGDLALNVTVDELLHDAAAARGRLELTAELIDRTTRTLVARRRFTACCGAGRTGERARRRRGAERGADERARRTRAVARSVGGEAARGGLALIAGQARCATQARAADRHATSWAAS